MVSVLGSYARGPKFESRSELQNLFFKTQEVSKCWISGVTILSICSSRGDNIDNIVTPGETYTKILSDLRTNERLSNGKYST